MTANTTSGSAVAVKRNTGVMSVADAMAAMQAMVAAQANKTGSVGGNTIRVTQDKKFVLPDGSQTNNPLEVVIVDFTSMNTFYDSAFDKNNVTPPTCFAIGDIPTSLVPSNNSPEKQADDCASCPMGAWGSGPNGGKACKNARLLAVLPADADAETPIWLIKTSPTAIKGFDGYVKSVQRMYGVPPIGVITTIGFDDNQSYATLTFGDPQPNEKAGVHLTRLDEAKELLAQEPDVSSYNAPAPAKAPAARRPAVARR